MLMLKDKNSSTVFIISGIIIAVVLAAVLVILPSLKPSTTLYLGDGVFNGRIAMNDADRKQGLSGLDSLPVNQALIMAYPGDGQWQIWMKDMKFPIDIIWLNSDKKVVYIAKNATPEDSTNTVFTPTGSARYVVEVPAGTVENRKITTNRTATFDIKVEDIK